MLFTASCGTTKSASKGQTLSLETTKWQIEELNGVAIAAKDDSFTIEFGADKRIGAKGSCNIIMGDYSYSTDGELSLKALGMTRSICPDMGTESKYIAALEATTSFSVTENLLTLFSNGEPVAKFKSY